MAWCACMHQSTINQVTNAGDYIYMVVNGACKHGDMAHFKEQMADFKGDVHMEYLETQQLLALQGKGAPAALQVGAVGAVRSGDAGVGGRVVVATVDRSWGRKMIVPKTENQQAIDLKHTHTHTQTHTLMFFL